MKENKYLIYFSTPIMNYDRKVAKPFDDMYFILICNTCSIFTIFVHIWKNNNKNDSNNDKNNKNNDDNKFQNIWEKAFTDDGRIYYFNRSLNLTSWKKPNNENLPLCAEEKKWVMIECDRF